MNVFTHAQLMFLLFFCRLVQWFIEKLCCAACANLVARVCTQRVAATSQDMTEAIKQWPKSNYSLSQIGRI